MPKVGCLARSRVTAIPRFAYAPPAQLQKRSSLSSKNAPASARSRSNLKQSSRFVGSPVTTPNLYKKINRDTNRYPVLFAEGRGRTDTRCDPHQILSLARLPIPSLRHEVLLYVISNIFFFQVLNFVLYLILTRGIGYAHY